MTFDPNEATEYLRDRLPEAPEALLVLGSGLSALAALVESPVEIPFESVPGLPGAGVGGHSGRYLAGRLEGRPVLVQAGRYHLYEGHPSEVVCAPVRIARQLGAGTVILTNAAGGIDRRLSVGAIMLLDDHLNLQWRSPLMGAVLEGEERFPDMSAPYDPGLQKMALAAASDLGIPLEQGIYAAVLGPSYETKAEIRMLARLGADAVGMSTVPEVLAARAGGMRVLAFSLITNRAAGLGTDPLGHAEVLEAGRRSGGELERLLRRIVRDLGPG